MSSSSRSRLRIPAPEGSVDQTRGVYRKYNIKRVDGRTDRDNDDYFVLNLTRDPHAAPALRAYASSAEKKFPLLAADLRHLASEMDEQFDLDSKTGTPVFTERQLTGALFDMLGNLTTKPPFDKMEAPLFLDIFEEWAVRRGLTIEDAEVETWDQAVRGED